MDLEWVRTIITVLSNITEFVSSILPAGFGALMIGAFTFLAFLGIKRVII